MYFNVIHFRDWCCIICELHLIVQVIKILNISFVFVFLNNKILWIYEQRKNILFIKEREREREMFYLTMHSTHFIYGYMVSDIWLRTILIVRKETCCRHIGYSYRLTAKVLLYAPSHRQDNTYHSLCYTSCGALALFTKGTRFGYVMMQSIHFY